MPSSINNIVRRVRVNGKLINYWLILPLFLYIPLMSDKNIFFSHAYLIGFLIMLCHTYKKSISSVIEILIAIIILSLVLVSAAYNGLGERFASDYIKICFYVFGVYFVSKSLPSEDLYRIAYMLARLYILTMPLYMLIYYLQEGSLFSFSGRLYLDYYGSPNAFASVAGAFLLVLFLSKDKVNYRDPLIWAYLLILYLAFSRAVIVAIFFSTVIYLFMKRYNYSQFIGYLLAAVLLVLSGALFVVMFKYGGSIDGVSSSVLTHAVEKGDSNRLYLWNLSIQQMLDAPSMWLFGFGPGQVLTEFVYGGRSHLIYHPHNTYIYLIYSMGFIGGGGVIFMWLLAGRGALKKYNSQRNIKMIVLFVYYSLIFLFDVHLSASQVIPYHLFILAYLYSNDHHKKHRSIN